MSIVRLLVVWAIIAVAMIANGAIREIVLVRQIGRNGADVASAALGILIILVITRRALASVSHQSSTATLIGISAAWVLLTIAFELIFGHFVDGKNWSELGANYAIWRGRLWPIVLLTLAVSPFIWARAGDTR